jgi:DNA-binding MarR family transcriptional regulator
MGKTTQRYTDPEALSGCTCAGLRKATRVVTQAYDAALQPLSLKATQFTVLAQLDAGGAAPLSQLADALVVDRTTLTRNLKPLVRNGWVRVDGEADQRVRQVVLTSAGARILKRAYPLWKEAQARVLKGLGKRRWAELLTDLDATVDVFSEA